MMSHNRLDFARIFGLDFANPTLAFYLFSFGIFFSHVRCKPFFFSHVRCKHFSIRLFPQKKIGKFLYKGLFWLFMKTMYLCPQQSFLSDVGLQLPLFQATWQRMDKITLLYEWRRSFSKKNIPQTKFKELFWALVSQKFVPRYIIFILQTIYWLQCWASLQKSCCLECFVPLL